MCTVVNQLMYFSRLVESSRAPSGIRKGKEVVFDSKQDVQEVLKGSKIEEWNEFRLKSMERIEDMRRKENEEQQICGESQSSIIYNEFTVSLIDTVPYGS